MSLGSDQPALPPSLRARLAPRLVGRESSFALVGPLLDRFSTGSRELLFVSGEPGIGKTAFVAQVGLDALHRGCTVLYGGCDVDRVVPYQPFAEALRGPIEALSPRELGVAIEAPPETLAPIAPALATGLSAFGVADPNQQLTLRYRFFEGIVAVLARCGRTAPTMLILDDLHWADDASIRLVQYVARHPRLTQLLLVATYRPTDINRVHTLRGALAELRADPGFTRLDLGGLEPEAVRELVADQIDSPSIRQRDALAVAVYEETGGNPLFVVELVRHLREERSVDELMRAAALGRIGTVGVPQRINELVDQRLARLPPPVVEVLQAASVLGRTFDVDVLREVSGRTVDELLDALDEGVASGFVFEPENAADAYAFSHALVRDALYLGLSSARRVRLHDQAVAALERLRVESAEYRRELAHHSLRAAPLGNTQRAVSYAEAAADQALIQLGFEEAASLYGQALLLFADVGAREDEQSVRLRLGRADALAWAGANYLAMDAYLEAVPIAKELGLAGMHARAALGYEQASYAGHGFVTDPEVRAAVDVLEDALAALDRTDVTRALVLNRLPRQLSFMLAPHERLRYAEAGLALADEIGDPLVRPSALDGLSWALLGPDDLERRLHVGAELVQAAIAADDAVHQFWGHLWQAEARLVVGDREGLDEELGQLDRIGEQLRAPFFRWWAAVYHATRASLDQRPEHVGKLAMDAYAIGARMETVLAEQMLGIQLMYVSYHSGQLAQLLEPARELAKRFSSIPAYDTGLMWMLAEAGAFDEARERFEIHATAGFDSIPRISTWLVTIAHLSETCCALDDTLRAQPLYDLLLPYSHCFVSGAIGVVCAGPVARYLAELATTMHDWDAAARHYDDALARCGRLRSRSWAAHTQGGYASMLLRRARPEDVAHAAELADDCRTTATDLGIARAARRVDAPPH